MIPAAAGAAAAFGAADYLGGLATARGGGVRRVLLVSEPVAVLVLLAVLPFVPGSLTAAAACLGVAAGLAAGAGKALLYTALARGPAGQSAPICGVVSVVVPVLYAVLAGRPTDRSDWTGFALTAAAVVALCASPSTLPVRSTLIASAGAGAAFGLYTVLLGRSTTDSSIWPVIVAHATVAAAAGVAGRRIRPVHLRAPAGHLRAGGVLADPVLAAPAVAVQVGAAPWPAALLGVAEAIAAVLLLLAARHDVAVTGALVALHPVVTVALARLLDREALTRWRLAGVALAAAGVLLLAGP